MSLFTKTGKPLKFHVVQVKQSERNELTSCIALNGGEITDDEDNFVLFTTPNGMKKQRYPRAKMYSVQFILDSATRSRFVNPEPYRLGDRDPDDSYYMEHFLCGFCSNTEVLSQESSQYFTARSSGENSQVASFPITSESLDQSQVVVPLNMCQRVARNSGVNVRQPGQENTETLGEEAVVKQSSSFVTSNNDKKQRLKKIRQRREERERRNKLNNSTIIIPDSDSESLDTNIDPTENRSSNESVSPARSKKTSISTIQPKEDDRESSCSISSLSENEERKPLRVRNIYYKKGARSKGVRHPIESSSQCHDENLHANRADAGESISRNKLAMPSPNSIRDHVRQRAMEQRLDENSSESDASTIIAPPKKSNNQSNSTEIITESSSQRHNENSQQNGRAQTDNLESRKEARMSGAHSRTHEETLRPAAQQSDENNSESEVANGGPRETEARNDSIDSREVVDSPRHSQSIRNNGEARELDESLDCSIQAAEAWSEKGKGFTPRERKQMIDFLITNKLIEDAASTRVWRRMRESGLLSYRPPSSLKLHFLNTILPNIELIKLDQNILDQFKTLRASLDL